MDDVAAADHTLELARRFAAPPERVFEAWTTAAWARWLPPFGATCAIAEMDPRVGGKYEVRMTMTDGREVVISGRYREIDPPRRLVMSWIGNYNAQETTLSVSFVADGAGTLMTLIQTGFVDPDLRAGYHRGWSGPDGSFDKLARLLAR